MSKKNLLTARLSQGTRMEYTSRGYPNQEERIAAEELFETHFIYLATQIFDKSN